MQRKRLLLNSGNGSTRNISACAEKTRRILAQSINRRKHLCMCRENLEDTIEHLCDGETSLHVQRKRDDRQEDNNRRGNISACAEKTCDFFPYRTMHWKHLCMCRENSAPPSSSMILLETSLHVQRKLVLLLVQELMLRNISACAEKTLGIVVGSLLSEETSLHVQRKLVLEPDPLQSNGNISACAEKTSCHLQAPPFTRKHLCMCRENPGHLQIPGKSLGNISACAEKTSPDHQKQP